MSKNKKQLGEFGEELATGYLQQHGYEIIDRNYRLKTGEIDIIASHQNDLVFIEVKTRTSLQFGTPASAVTMQKQRQISKVAEEYLLRNKLLDKAARFDVVTVLVHPDGNSNIEIIANAFELQNY